MGRMIRLLAVILVTLFGRIHSAAAAMPPFTLDVLPGNVASATLPARSGAQVPLNILRTTAMSGVSETIDLWLSQFVGERGDAIEVGLIVGDKSTDTSKPLRVTVIGPIVPIRLSIPALPAAGKYIGSLILIQGKMDPLSWRITLAPPGPSPQAKLEVNPRDVSLSVTRCLVRLSCSGNENQVYVSVAEKTGLFSAERITVLQEQGTKGFDYQKHLEFSFGGKPAPNFGDSSQAGQRIIPPGSQVPIGMTVKDLAPGEYTASLRFRATNSADDDAQKVKLTVQVRHRAEGAAAVLLLALLVSFVMTKVLVKLRQSLTFVLRVRDLRPAWLATMDPILPVVWVRDTLHQVEALDRCFWLTGQDVIETRLNQVSGLLGVLEKVHQIQRDFDRHGPPGFVRIRALAALGRIVSSLDGAALSDEATAQVKAELDGLAGWLDVSKQKDSYWEDLSRAASDLLREVNSAEILDPASRATIDGLVQELGHDIAGKPQTLDEMMKVEEKYARLKILWERRPPAGEFSKLVSLQQGKASLAALFKEADDAAWERLQKASPRIVLPQDNGVEPLKAYDPLTFRIETPGDTAVGTSYLFLHGLKYKWTFVQKSEKGVVQKFWGESTVPSVVAYADQTGLLNVSVSIEYDGRMFGKTTGFEVNVAKPADIKAFLLSYEWVEVASFLFAVLVAMVSGLSLYYAKNPIFGTLQDYLGLVVWGVGVDQGKNLIQALQMWSPTPAKAP